MKPTLKNLKSISESLLKRKVLKNWQKSGTSIQIYQKMAQNLQLKRFRKKGKEMNTIIKRAYEMQADGNFFIEFPDVEAGDICNLENYR